MAPGVVTKVIAAICGLGAFAVAIIAGLNVDNPSPTILGRALIGMVAGYVVGYLAGLAGEYVIDDASTRYRASRPVPESINPGAAEADEGEVLSV